MPKKPKSKLFRPPKRLRVRPRRSNSSEDSSMSPNDVNLDSANVSDQSVVSMTSSSAGADSPAAQQSQPSAVDSQSASITPLSVDVDVPLERIDIEHNFRCPPAPSPLVSPTISEILSCSLSPNSDEGSRLSWISNSSSDVTSDYLCPSPTPANLSFSYDEPPSSVASEPDLNQLPPEECQAHISTVCSRVSLFLPANWIVMLCEGGINVMLISRKTEKAIQRRICVTAAGVASLSVHGTPLDIKPYMTDLSSPGSLSEAKINSFVDFIASLVSKIRVYEICSGADHQEYKSAWNSTTDAYIDNNYFQECRYEETLRFRQCKLLVDPIRWRCAECSKSVDRLRKKIVSVAKEEAHPNAPTVHLTDAQKSKRLEAKTKVIDATRKNVDRLKKKMSLLIKEEGLFVDRDLGLIMQEAIQSQNLSPSQALFLQQQLKASQCKTKSGMRWHPHLIRFALSIFMQSPSTYSIIVESGLVRLPHQNTLYDYSHVFEVQEGVCMPIVKSIVDRVVARKEEKFKWHVLLCDEMHISKNIVYHRRTGTLKGFVKLSTLEQELKKLQNYLDNCDSTEPAIASKMLSFMVKGVCTNVKEVVSSFSIDTLNKEKLFSLTWNVIYSLEACGIKVISMTSDGNAVNRAFFKMNTPLHPTKSGVVYDSINKAAPSRPIFFISDVPHLVKTIRNNFYNSRPGRKGKRCLTKNGQKIVWTTIIRLFHEKKHKVLRKSFKLTHANVFPDSYSCMKVKYAFQVLSNTVANDLESQGWPDTLETVHFIRLVNNFADCLNGLHTSEATRKANPLLAPYRDPNDERIGKHLLGFLDYLEEWKAETHLVNQSFLNQSGANADDSFQSLHDVHEEGGLADGGPTHKKLLCHQTLEGIEITVRGFIGAVQYLLTEGGVSYINARVFCQDPLEQYFSKQRAKGEVATIRTCRGILTMQEQYICNVTSV